MRTLNLDSNREASLRASVHMWISHVLLPRNHRGAPCVYDPGPHAQSWFHLLILRRFKMGGDNATKGRGNGFVTQWAPDGPLVATSYVTDQPPYRPRPSPGGAGHGEREPISVPPLLVPQITFVAVMMFSDYISSFHCPLIYPSNAESQWRER